ncbi:hypothetical protein [Pseudonocardia sp. N23]|uniref:hypothetical protein n=1 Tax=Pseudonocardia sp. N23 TaxID=1987376 RepID=UPI000BFBEAD4|nr:hypothetical protein [Pseudonocardia sp. N23]GAY08050.1 hypothetical protein TOK_6243 [Pseudonocardia sp. N23]
MLVLVHEQVAAGMHDADFLQPCTVGRDRFDAHLLGRTDGVPKTPGWAARISGLPVRDTATRTS